MVLTLAEAIRLWIRESRAGLTGADFPTWVGITGIEMS